MSEGDVKNECLAEAVFPEPKPVPEPEKVPVVAGSCTKGHDWVCPATEPRVLTFEGVDGIPKGLFFCRDCLFQAVRDGHLGVVVQRVVDDIPATPLKVAEGT